MPTRTITVSAGLTAPEKKISWCYRVAIILIAALAHFGTVRLGVSFAHAHGISSIWPASGFAVGALLLLGAGTWPAILLSCVLNAAMRHFPPLSVLGAGVANVLGAFTAYGIIQWNIHHSRLERVYAEAFGVLTGAFTSAVVSATLGVGTLALTSANTDTFATTWTAWLVGSILGVLTITPLFMHIKPAIAYWRQLEGSERRNTLLLYAASAASLSLIFAASDRLPTAFLAFIVLLFVALREEPLIADVLVALTAVLTAILTANGIGPFHGGDLATDLMNTQLFVAGFAISSLLLQSLKAATNRRLPLTILVVGWIVAAGLTYFIDEHKRLLDELNLQSIAEVTELSASEQIDRADFKPLLQDLPAFISHRDFTATAIGATTALLALALSLIVVNLQSLRYRARDLAQRMTKELADRERLWMTLTESAPVGIFQTDMQGRCMYANQRWVDLTGVALRDARGFSWLSTVHPADQRQVLQSWLDLKDGQPFQCQYRTTKSGESETWVTGFAAPTLDATGQITGYLGTVQDITEIKKQQHDLITSSKMSSLGEMAAGIAHEINNPLMIISAVAEQVRRQCDREELDPAKAKAAANQIGDTVRRIAKIISGLKAFARNADRDPSLPTTIGAVIEATFGLCNERFRVRGIDVKVSGDMDTVLECRAVQLSQVLLNLLSNAYDAVESQTAKWVKIESKATESDIFIRVTDSGPRISETIAAKIMQPFFTTKPVGKGTGLGLSISKGIVEDHGGTLTLCPDSTTTSFIIKLPRKMQET